MAVAATTVFEVRTTGSDLNGGGFDPSLGGTDYSQQNSAQATGTVTSVGTTVTATTSIFTSVMVGNLITDGTTWKEITAFTSATIVTVDSAPSWTAASIKVGGALANLQTAINASNGSNLIWVKQGSGYSTSANITGGVSVVPGQTSTTLPNRLYGYGTTRGDGGKATITAASGCTIVLAMTTNGWWIQNLVIDCASIANVAINYAGNWWQVANCTLKNFTQYGANLQNQFPSIASCYLTGGTAAATAAINVSATQGTMVDACEVASNSCTGIATGGACAVTNCLIHDNSGSSSDGISLLNGYATTLRDNTIYNNGRDGIQIGNQLLGVIARNNILASNGRYGLNFVNGGMPSFPFIDGNAYWSNTSGATNGIASGPHDVTLSGNPFTNPGSGDFSLNNTAGAGAACRAAGIPGVFPGGTTTGYPDIGAVQHQDSGGGVSNTFSMIF